MWVGGDEVMSVCCGVKWLRRSAGCKGSEQSGILKGLQVIWLRWF